MTSTSMICQLTATVPQTGRAGPGRTGSCSLAFLSKIGVAPQPFAGIIGRRDPSPWLSRSSCCSALRAPQMRCPKTPPAASSLRTGSSRMRSRMPLLAGVCRSPRTRRGRDFGLSLQVSLRKREAPGRVQGLESSRAFTSCPYLHATGPQIRRLAAALLDRAVGSVIRWAPAER